MQNEPGALTETRGIGPSHRGGDDKPSLLSLASHQDRYCPCTMSR